MIPLLWAAGDRCVARGQLGRVDSVGDGCASIDIGHGRLMFVNLKELDLALLPKEKTVTDDYESFVESKLTRTPSTGLSEVPRLHPSLFPFQRDLVAWALRRGRAALFADTGTGKAQPIDEVVLTPDGWRAIGDMRVGDAIIAGDGSVTSVVGVFPQGSREVARVSFSDGASARCDLDHLWCAQSDLGLSRNQGWRVMSLRDLDAKGLHCPDGRARWRVPVVSAVEHPHADLPIDPYVLGCLLGDGSFRSRFAVQLTSADDDLVAEVGRCMPSGMTITRDRAQKSAASTYRLVRRDGAGTTRPNPIMAALRDLGLWNHLSEHKFIPQSYMFAGPEQRLSLLEGLLDTDGYISADGMVQFGSSSKRLFDDVVALVRSLGGICRTFSKMPRYTHRGEMRTGLEHWVATIAWPGETGHVRLSRKRDRFVPRSKYRPMRKIVGIELAGRSECVCISVAHASHTYVTHDYVVTHNTRMQIEWARHVLGDVLVLAPLAVAAQTAREGEIMGVKVTMCRDGADVKPGINITNYERLHRFDTSRFTGVVMDESSCLKHYDSKTLGIMLSAFPDTPFKLCATATPSPNDYAELGTHAEFLGACSRTEMLSEFFCHDGGETQVWRLKGHARAEFWKWVASWAAMLRKPSDLGYSDDGYVLPPLDTVQHTLAADDATTRAAGLLFAQEASTLSERRTARKASLNARVDACVDQVAREPGCRWVVWCDLNAEQDALAAAFGNDCISVYGSLDVDEKERRLTEFVTTDRRILLGKPSIFGFGLNLQMCTRMAFVGVTDSYEAYYQAVRRCWRYGQKEPVVVHVFASELEGAVIKNLARKQRDADAMAEQLSAETQGAVRAEVHGMIRTTNTHHAGKRIAIPAWLQTETRAT